METPNLRVRELRRKDIPAVIELFQGSFPRELEVMGFNPETVRKQLRLYGLARLVQRLTRKPFVLFWVGEVAGEIVATVTLTRKRGSWYISTVMVAPEHRRRGYGRAMVEHALGVIRTQGGRRAVLHVLEDNLPAKRLYEGAGFSRFERVVHLVREPPEAGESPLPQGYKLVRIGMFDPRAAQLTYAAMEPDSAEVYGPPQVPPWYIQALARRQPGLREPHAVVREGEWVGVYSFSAPFGTKGAASAGISLLPEHRGLGLEEALLSLALARARELGCPRLLVRANEANGALLSACERLGFTRLYAMEGMYRDI